MIVVSERLSIYPERVLYFKLLAPSRWTRITIYTTKGQTVRTIKLGPLPAGTHSIKWDGRNDKGEKLAVGLYFCTITTDSAEVTTKYPVAPQYGCVEDRVRAGEDLHVAIVRCQVLPDVRVEILKHKECISDCIRKGSSWVDCLEFCTTMSALFPPVEPLPDVEPVSIPGWVWGLIGFLGLFLLK